MARRRKKREFTTEVKREAVEAAIGGEAYTAVCERYSIVPSLLRTWRIKYENGALGEPGEVTAKVKGKAKAKAKAKASANGAAHVHADVPETTRTPEALFTSRVNQAIILLRQAWKEVKRMEDARKIKGPDKAHSLAYVALLELQGDNGQ